MDMPNGLEISAARLAADLTQAEAANVVHADVRSWQRWEGEERRINLAAWELFLIKTGTTPAQRAEVEAMLRAGTWNAAA